LRGAHVHLKIEQRVRSLEDQYGELGRGTTESEARLRSLGSELDDQYEKLSRMYLPRLDPQAAALTQLRYPKMYERLKDLLADKAAERTRLEQDSEEISQDRIQLERQFDRVTGDIETKVVERNGLRQAVERELEASTRFVELKDGVAKARKNLEQWHRRLDRARAERETKLPEYDRNELFAYLKGVEYGTERHRAGVVTGWLDSLVAERLDYLNQKNDYDYLLDVASAMEGAFDEASAELAEVEEPLATRVHEVSDRLGLSRVISEGEALYRKRVEIVGRLETGDAELRRLTQRIEELESGRSDYYRQALSDYADFLESQDGQRLISVAEATRAQGDDDYVIRIQRLEAELRDERRKLQLLVEDRVSVGNKLHRLRELESRFRRNDYDASNSDFYDGFDIDRLLIEVLEEGLALEEAAAQMKRHHHFKVKRSSWSSSSGGRSSGGGFSSRSSFSSGGGFSSGGFSTGGGF